MFHNTYVEVKKISSGIFICTFAHLTALIIFHKFECLRLNRRYYIVWLVFLILTISAISNVNIF